ncbi:MAG: hypothetical protein KME42_02960 [Tildeniella nuda ZEHNDER 1965/U140]|nr:hypothetical protein [Tildeniella nuda ZEHNDER 1965/U140]
MKAWVKALAKYPFVQQQVCDRTVVLISSLTLLLPLYSGFFNPAWTYAPSTEEPTGMPTEVLPTQCQPL